MSQNQDNPDIDYAKWQQEHDQRRRELYDDSDTNTYEYENNSSFTATPQKDYSSSQSIFGSESQQNSQYSTLTAYSSQHDYSNFQNPDNHDSYIEQNKDQTERFIQGLQNTIAYAVENFAPLHSSNGQQNDNEAFMFQDGRYVQWNAHDDSSSQEKSSQD